LRLMVRMDFVMLRRFLGGKRKAHSELKIQQAVCLRMTRQINGIPLVRACQGTIPEVRFAYNRGGDYA